MQLELRVPLEARLAHAFAFARRRACKVQLLDAVEVRGAVCAASTVTNHFLSVQSEHETPGRQASRDATRDQKPCVL